MMNRVSGAVNSYVQCLLGWNHVSHHHRHHLGNMELGQLLIRSVLTHQEVSLMVSPGFFCLLVFTFSVLYPVPHKRGNDDQVTVV